MRKVPWTIWLAWQRVDVSDSHVVRSQAVWPVRTTPVYVASPMFVPCTVTLADPVAALFDLLAKLNMASSTETPDVILPTRFPDVSDTRKVPFTIWLAWHRIEVSESQLVLSQVVWPVRTA